MNLLDNDDPLPGLDPSKIPQRVFISQLIFSFFLGFIGFIVFCYLRPKYPEIYSIRTVRNKDIKPLSKRMFQWIRNIYYTNDEEILEICGLDSYVFLCFFKISIKILSILTFISVLIIAPIRYYVTGHYDHEDTVGGAKTKDGGDDYYFDEFPAYLWVYAIFTYVFVILCLYYLLDQSKKIIDIRQKYLGSQKSLTDKTIKLEKIPKKLRNEHSLKQHIESLGIGKVAEVNFNRDWDILNQYMKERKQIVTKLEQYYVKYFGMKVQIVNGEVIYCKLGKDINAIGQSEESPDRPTIKTGFLGLFGKKVDAINYYLTQLKIIDKDIENLRQRSHNFTILNSAFITMDSVESAQMIAQAVLDPEVNNLIASTAPSSKDLIWQNFSVKENSYRIMFRNYTITFFFIITSVLLIFPVSYLAAFINVETITKIWPDLGDFIAKSKWLTTLVTGILPPTLFSLLNLIIPYFYNYLSSKQIFHSITDVELSAVSKNFFYAFFNLFLVFTIAGSASNFWSYFTDTRKIAYQLANSIKKLALFYNNLILLQGIGIFPYKLLQFGDIFLIFWYKVVLKSTKYYDVRAVRYFYNQPKSFDFGLILPQPILIFMITIIYSIISTKLLSSGLVYFVLGYFVYKYQLIYSMIHPQHSTGKVWLIIIHRMLLGLVIFELTMIGTLALENAYVLAVSLIPLIGATFWFYYNFEKYYRPLLYFIALRSIKAFQHEDNEDNEAVYDADESNVGFAGNVSMNSEISTIHVKRNRAKTFDEIKETNSSYQHPFLREELLGPWVGFKNDSIDVVKYDNCKLIKNMTDDIRVDLNKPVDITKIVDVINDEYAGEKVETRDLVFSEWE